MFRAKILVVDDQPANLMVMRKLLASVDVEVITAESGNEALALCQEHEFALLLLDVQMPDMDGFEVAQWLHDAGMIENMPILFVTAFPAEGARRTEAYRVGGVDFIQKPVNDEVLLSKVRVFLELYNSRRRLEIMVRELAQARDRADDANRAKSRFLATMSHEIRTPMHGILGFADLLSTTALNEEQISYVEIINSSGQGLLTIINDILDFSKIDAGRLQLEQIPFDLKQLLRNTLQLFAVPVRNKGLEMVFQTFPNVPEVLKGDPNRLRQILYNLLGNALKFTENGRIALFVEIMETDEHTILLRFSVDDTGIGIAPESVLRILEPFVQADDSTTRCYGGTGLGLSIVVKLVELMGGGELDIRSAVGKGSSFRFCVRLAHCSSGETMAVTVFDTLKNEISTLLSQKILIVEDDAVSLRLAAEILRVVGVQRVVQVENGLEALAAMAQESFDLLLTDCDMPVMDGYTLTREIRRLEREEGRKRLVIIALTANVLEEHQHHCVEAGLDGFVPKPFTAEALLQAIHHGLVANVVKKVKPAVEGANLQADLVIASDEHAEQLRNFLVAAREQLDHIHSAVEQENFPGAIQRTLVLKEISTATGVDALRHKSVRLKVAMQSEDGMRAKALVFEMGGVLDDLAVLLAQQEGTR